MLYKLKENELESIAFEDFGNIGKKEKDLENIFAQNLEMIYGEYGVLFPVFQERPGQEAPDLCALDKEGNLNKWWLDKDYEAFEEKQKEMIALFDGVETEVGPANGKLIVSENIADQGGITAALTAAKDEKDVDLKAFFRQWAKIWRMKASKEFQQMLLSMDVHAPAKLRANIPPTNLEEFYETFDVKETDKMYRAPENRLKIW